MNIEIFIGTKENSKGNTFFYFQLLRGVFCIGAAGGFGTYSDANKKANFIKNKLINNK